MVSLAMFCFCFSCFGFVNWVADWWNADFGISPETANRYVSLFAVISLPVVVLAGFILYHVDRKRFCILISAGYVFAVAAAFLLPGPGWILPFVIVYPFFEGSVSACLWTLIPLTVKDPRHAVPAIALFTLTSNAGTLVGPPAVGSLVETFGSWQIGAAPVAISMILATLLLIRVRTES